MTIASVEDVASIAARLQRSCSELNALAREVQVGERSDEDAIERADWIGEEVTAILGGLPDEDAAAMAEQFRARLVPSAQKAWDQVAPRSLGGIKVWVRTPTY